MIILDFYGATGGVGRGTREIIRQLESRNARIIYSGMDGLVRRFRGTAPELNDVEMWSLNRPRGSSAYFKLLFYRKFRPQSSGYSDALLSEARRRGGSEMATWRILVNFPHFTPPPRRESGYAVLIHDLNWIYYPGNFTLPRRANEWCAEWIERAGMVVTNSEFTKEEVMRHYRCPSAKVMAAPFAPYVESDTGIDNNLLARLGLNPGKYFLYPTVWGLHKGLEVLTEALERAQGADPVVVTCGDTATGIDGDHVGVATLRRRLHARWERLRAQKRLVTVLDLPDAEMQTLRRHTKAFVLPSRFEGFGFPLAEAIYNYRPVIVSNIPANREILNRYPQYDLATQFHPESSEALTAALLQPIAHPAMPPDWHNTLNASWSWKNTVDCVIAATRIG